METHVLQHHNAAKEQGSRVGKALASNIGGRAMDSLEDRALPANVTGGSETETTDQASAHVRENVTVQIGHHKHLIVVGCRVGSNVQASVVQQLSVELDIREVLGDVTGKVEEETVGHLHDGGLVYNTDLLLVDRAGVLEGIAEDTLRSILGDELDALHNTWYNDMLDTRVFTLGVLTDQNGVDIVVGCLVSCDRPAGTDVGEKVECTTQGQV